MTFTEIADSLLPLADSSVSQTVGIAATGMLIVFIALGLISLFLTLSPRLMRVLAVFFPESEHGHDHSGIPSDGDPSDDEEILAAIGFLMHTEKSHNA